jgi:WXXGXW repeat (2 copies)
MKLRLVGLIALLFAAFPSEGLFAQVGVSINIAPPVLPIVEQPPCPAEGYLWTPGYWAYGDMGYYWAPGYWVQPPEVGLLWTPPYWGFGDGVYVFHEGYWGPRVGFYGGINYGYGYFGNGFYGGRWDGNVFRYNTAVTRVNTTVIRNVYVDRAPLKQKAQAGRASFNGPGGVKAESTAEEKAAAEARHVPATSAQVSRQEAASKNRDLLASANHGQPKPAAIKALDRNERQASGAGQAQGGAEKAASKTEANLKNEKNETGRTETARKEEESRSAERHREAMANARNHEAEARAKSSTSARENARRDMTQRSRRPDAAAPRQETRGNRAQPSAQQQRKGKPAKPGQSPDQR